MKKVLSLLLLVMVFHFVGVYFGIYDAQIQNGNVWYDNFLHFLTGIAFGLLWLWISRNRTATSISVLIFVLATALAWELLEFGIFKLSGNYALSLKIYSPTIMEAAVDVLSNFAGGVALLIYKNFMESKKDFPTKG